MVFDDPPFKDIDGLVGRDAEAQLLQGAYQRVLESPRSCEVVLIHGESGTGKTALVQNCFQQQENGGTLISGKFDIIHNNPKPYSAFVDALMQLCLPAIWKNISDLEGLKEITRKWFSTSDLQMLGKLAPAVELRLASLIVGSIYEESDSEDSLCDQSSVDSTFAFSRFTELVRSFLYMVARFLPSPLILFLDDIQAADKESLSLVSSLTSLHKETCNLLLILAYRDPVDNDLEVKQNSMVSPTTVFQINNIQLRNLDAINVNKLISEMLRMNEDETDPLSHLVTQRTGGNVYFSLQFLNMFRKQTLLKYSYSVYKWEWDLERIRSETNVTENVALLLTSRIQQLPSSVQLVLQLAACLGFYFDISVLEQMAFQGKADNGGGCAQGRSGSASGFLSSEEFAAAIAVAFEESLIDRTCTTKYKFTHDRVLQAAYEMIPEGRDRETMHWRIGQVLWKQVQQQRSQSSDQSQTTDDWVLFAAADQLNRASNYGISNGDVVSPLDLARLNLEAGKTALEKSAFKHAAGFFNTGVEITKDMWESEYSLCLDLHTLSAEAEYAGSNFVTCDSRVCEILANGRCLEDKLRAYLVKVQSDGVRGNILKALDDSRAVLRKLGERIPRRPNFLNMVWELAKTKRDFRNREISDFVSLPDMTDPLKIWATKFLQNATLYSWYGGRTSSLVVTACRMARLTLKFGLSSQGPVALSTYGILLGAIGDMTSAYEVGRVSLELAKRPNMSGCYARTAATVFSFMNYMKEPVVKNLDHYMEGYNTGLKSGEIDGAAMCLAMYGVLGIYLGKNLNIVLAELDGFRQAYRYEMGSNFSMIAMLPWHQFVLNMLGRSDNPLQLTGEILCEDSFLSEARRTGNYVSTGAVNVTRMILRYMFCEFEAASKEVAKLDVEVYSAETHVFTAFVLTFTALTMLASARKTRKHKDFRRARLFVKLMKRFAKSGNLNMPPLLELVGAEAASLRRRSSPEMVKRAYESAVRLASQSGFSVFEAIGSERGGEYMLSVGDTFWAETYLSRAYRLYDEWGAAAKTNQMVDRHSFLVDRSGKLSGSQRSIGLSMRKRYSYKAFNKEE